MPARVHAIIVARTGSSSRAQLLRTLDALRAQTTPAAAVTLVVCGDASSVRESEAVASTVEGIIEARATTSFAEAVELARPRVAEGSAIWLLAQDTTPHPRALERLSGMLERSPSAAIIAPKLVASDNDREIVSLGVSMTALGRSVELAAGELDQGQHDRSDDALGADVRGLLIRGEVRDALRPDPALAGADEGLDLGVRARLGGGRVVLAPGARVSVSPMVLPRCRPADSGAPSSPGWPSSIGAWLMRLPQPYLCTGSACCPSRCGARSPISSRSARKPCFPNGVPRSRRCLGSAPSCARAQRFVRSAPPAGPASRRCE